MISDPIANMISIIKNGYLSRQLEVSVPYSSFKEKIAQVLVAENFLDGIEVKKDKKNSNKNLVMKLKYENKKPVITEIKQVSKTSLRVYTSCSKIPKVLGGLGTCIISTPGGVVSTKKAKKLHSGGEIICRVW